MSNNTLQKNGKDVLSVSQLNRQIKRLIEQNYSAMWIEGEIANFAQPSSGHWYFTLTDEKAQVRCAMFRSRNQRLRFQPEPGQKVLIKANASLYEGRGEYQLIVEGMQLSGDGALMLAFEQLKKKLDAEGLFSEQQKKALPDVPSHIAVITSATGAAVHDVLTVLERRFPSILISLIPVTVQGNTAPNDIVNAIGLANRAAKTLEIPPEVILLTRGGGSMEDLWAFNDEKVARAIHTSALPLVSAIGHEVDFTIADFVADVRAATPSAAAEMLSPDQQEWFNKLIAIEHRLENQISDKIVTEQQQLDWLSSQLIHPGRKITLQQNDVTALQQRLLLAIQRTIERSVADVHIAQSQLMHHHPRFKLQTLKLKLQQQQQTLKLKMDAILVTCKSELSKTSKVLSTVSPLATLERGYSVTTDQHGSVLRNAQTVTIGSTIKTRLAKGHLICEVKNHE